MNSLINIINNYCKNDITKKEIKICKKILLTDLLCLNFLPKLLDKLEEKKNITKLIIYKKEIDNIKKISKKYISCIDIVISKIIKF